MLDELRIEANEESFVIVLQHGGYDITCKLSINGLQSIPRDSTNKDVAAMLDELTIEANEESFVIVLQHGGNDITCKQCMSRVIKCLSHQMHLACCFETWQYCFHTCCLISLVNKI